jgi:hypothetical protein
VAGRRREEQAPAERTTTVLGFEEPLVGPADRWGRCLAPSIGPVLGQGGVVRGRPALDHLVSDGVDGVNIGINSGRAAGQTVAHAHVHAIPRRDGDVPDPRGGVRYVIADKADYWSTR